MKKTYYFDKGKITKVSSKQMPTSIDDAGTGWIYTDISGMVKPELQKISGQWQVVETATPEQIQKFNQAKQQEQFENFMQKKLAEGQEYYASKSKAITMQLFGRPQSEVNPIIIEIDDSITPILDKIKTGDWYSAMLLQLPQPTIQEVVDILNEVKTDIQNYVQENYH